MYLHVRARTLRQLVYRPNTYNIYIYIYIYIRTCTCAPAPSARSPTPARHPTEHDANTTRPPVTCTHRAHESFGTMRL